MDAPIRMIGNKGFSQLRKIGFNEMDIKDAFSLLVVWKRQGIDREGTRVRKAWQELRQ